MISNQPPSTQKKGIFILYVGYAALLVYLLLTGCSPKYTKKECEQFCKIDTIIQNVTIKDTIYISEHSKDSTFSAELDTVIIQDSVIKIFYIRTKDNVYIKGTCLADTVYKERVITVKVPTKQIVYSTWDHVKESRWFIVIAFLSGLALGLYLTFRKQNK